MAVVQCSTIQRVIAHDTAHRTNGYASINQSINIYESMNLSVVEWCVVLWRELR